MNDTPPAVEARVRRLLSERTPAERLRMSTAMFGTARALAVAGIGLRHGPLDEGALRLELLKRFYGTELCPRQLAAVVATLQRVPG